MDDGLSDNARGSTFEIWCVEKSPKYMFVLTHNEPNELGNLFSILNFPRKNVQLTRCSSTVDATVKCSKCAMSAEC
jgi:hypothetical protein